MKNSALWRHTRIVALSASIATFAGCGVQAIPRQLNEVEAAAAEIQNQVQRRADLVPSLVNTVKGYAQHEKQTLESVMAARASATQIQLTAKDLTPEKLAEFDRAQNQLKGALSRLMAVAENYPNLKADSQFRDLQTQLEGTENRIAVARNRYIESVKQFNNLVSVFPTNLTNSLIFHHEKKPQFQASEAAQAAPEVKF